MTQSKLMSTSDVITELRISPATLYRLLNGDFPRPFKITTQKNAWFRTDVEAWIAQRAAVVA